MPYGNTFHFVRKNAKFPNLAFCSADLLYENKHEYCHCKDVCLETKFSTSISQSTFPDYSVAFLLHTNGEHSYERQAFIRKLM